MRAGAYPAGTDLKRVAAVAGTPQPGLPTAEPKSSEATGAFVTLDGERYYAIGNVDKIPPFFMSLVSDNDHWIFVASNGGLTAGRVSPDTALFPYVTVDKIYDSTPHTGCKTLLRVELHGKRHHWEPFNREHDGRFSTTRNLYKSVIGNKLLFEEINHDLHLSFRYRWACSDTHGFVRQVELQNHGSTGCRVELVDGLQNLLPAGTPRSVQTSSSYLVDAYKWSELDESTGLAHYSLFSGISDRAEPRESLRATTVFCLGLEGRQVLLSTGQLDRFRRGESLTQETRKRGLRGAYLVSAALDLAAATGRLAASRSASPAGDDGDAASWRPNMRAMSFTPAVPLRTCRYRDRQAAQRRATQPQYPRRRWVAVFHRPRFGAVAERLRRGSPDLCRVARSDPNVRQTQRRQPNQLWVRGRRQTVSGASGLRP